MYNKRTAIVIGAGAGGTGVSAFLARNSFSVTVLEKNSFVGGVCSSIENNGHRFDRGPFIFLYNELYEKIFEELDEKMSDHIDILDASGIMFIFADGSHFELTPDFGKLCEQIERFEGKRNMTSIVLQFFAECQNWVDLADELTNNGDNFVNYRNIVSLLKHVKWHFYFSIRSRVSKYFQNEHLKQVFSMSPLLCGLSPNNTISPFNAIVGILGLNKFRYPKYGMQSIVKAVENIATKKYGAKFVYNKTVSKININEKNVATGVTLEDGTVLNADVVVCNADIVYSYNKLLPETKYGNKLANTRIQADSAIAFYWSLKTNVPELRFLQFFFPKNYFDSFKDYSDDNWCPERTFLLFLPNRIDVTAAPKNKDSVVVFITIGRVHNKNEYNFKEAIEKARRYVIATVEKRLNIQNLESFIENEIIMDPNEWTEQFNLWNCSALGMSLIATQLYPFRPSNRCSLFKLLYFVGASTNPGIGVNPNLYFGKIIANQIVNDLNDEINRFPVSKMVILGFIGILIVYLFSSFCH